MRLFLLSDLHFGRAQADLVPFLLEAARDHDPDLVVIAGDFVQRARASQYRKARDFLDRLRHPWVAVPGNHDIPLFNLMARVLTPRLAYRRWIHRDTEPLIETGTAVIAGVDTTHRWSHQRGAILRSQIDRIADLIRRNAAERAVAIVAHHPFHHSSEIEKKLMLGAPRALESWAGAGRHMILSGHLHRWMVEPFVTRKSQSMTLQVHCGTSLSTRLRGELNECALIDLGYHGVDIRRLVVAEQGGGYVEAERHRFKADDAGWRRSA